MTSRELNKKVSELLKKVYEGHPDVKNPFRIKSHTKVFVDLLQCPLLWVYLAAGGTSGDGSSALASARIQRSSKAVRDLERGVQLSDQNRSLIEKRLAILEEYFKRCGEDKADLKDIGRAADYERARVVFRGSEAFGETTALSEVVTSATSDVDSLLSVAQGVRMEGVVVDLFKTGPASEWVGYVTPGCVLEENGEDATAGASKPRGRFAPVLEFNSRAFGLSCPLHVGDVVEFRQLQETVGSRSRDSVVDSSMRVVEFFPGTIDIEDYLNRFLSLKPCQQTVPSFFWRSVLNSSQEVCRQQYPKILAVYDICVRGGSITEEGRAQMMKVFGENRFITDVGTFVMQDTRDSSPEEKENDAKIAAHLLTNFVCQFPREAYTVAESLRQLIQVPAMQSLPDSVKSVALAVIKSRQSVPPQQESQTSRIQEEAPWLGGADLLCQNALLWPKAFAGGIAAEHIDPKHRNLESLLSADEEVVARRKSLLRVQLQGSSDEGSHNFSHEQLQELSSTLLEKKLVCTRVHVQMQVLPNSESFTGAEGVVVDLYPSPQPGKFEGYVVRLSSSTHRVQDARPPQVYKFNQDVALMSDHKCDGQLPLHIGDVVFFKFEGREVVAIQDVSCYSPHAIDNEFAKVYLDTIDNDGLETIQKWPAPWKAILNAPHVYRRFFLRILGVYEALKSSSDLVDAVEKSFIAIFSRSKFVCDIPSLLSKDAHGMDGAKTAAKLLAACVQLSNPEVTLVLGNTLKHLVELLLELQLYRESQELMVVLVDYFIQPPPDVVLKKRPWKSIPPLLSAVEFREGLASSIMPSRGDCDPNLPKVKKSGRYESVEEYGRTYYTLLRADCYGELLQTIARLKDQGGSHGNQDSPDDIYYDAQFTGLARGWRTKRIVYCFDMEANQAQRSVGAESNEPTLMMDGNLLCFSIGGKFEDDILWATISHVASTARGWSQVQVELCSEANELPDEKAIELLNKSRDVVAVESPAYFRAYQPVLEALRSMDIDKIHFKEDLLDPSSLVKSKPVIVNVSSTINPAPVFIMETAVASMTVGELITALEEGKSKDGRKFCLNESQRRAVCQVLSQPLTLIQGPPGTGKTYIAEKLMELFLSLSTLPKDKPIIIIAYRNRALDHILCHCTTFCPEQKIVRIGHLSKDYESMQNMLLGRKVAAEMNRKHNTCQQNLDKTYLEVTESCREVAERGKASLDTCLQYLTPQWLQSLLLEAPPDTNQSLNLPPSMKQKLTESPHACLKMLQQQGILGRADRGERDMMRSALDKAWRVWTTGIILEADHYQPTRSKKIGGSLAESDTEKDFEEMEERHMADDEDEEFSQSDSHSELSLGDGYDWDEEYEGVPVYDNHVWDLPSEKRRQLILSQVSEQHHEALDTRRKAFRAHNAACDEYEWKRQAVSLEILRKARIVGMTTTGAAIHQEVINKLESPLVFVEEAAEVLESNLLATLTPHVKHLVLIGDHKQLQPKVACPRLRKHQFHVSMFERLACNNFPRTLLMMQSRMHPTLVPLYSYKYKEQSKEGGEIRSPPKVDRLVHPRCMKQQFFWWTYPHDQPNYFERREGNRILNTHEADMVVALCLWLLSQGEVAEDIAVLTPYRAQVELIKKSLKVKSHQLPPSNKASVFLSCVQVVTVDEFQGHESPIVILSLVRNNAKGRIGFLGNKNRLTVATSRQKKALYIIGNEQFLWKNSLVTFKEFIETVKGLKLNGDCIGQEIPVVSAEKVSTADQLEKLACASESLSHPTSLPTFDRHQSSPARLGDTGITSPTSPGITSPTSPISPMKLVFLELMKTGGVASEWKMIGRKLGLEDSKIEKINSDERGIEEQCYQILTGWARSCSKPTPKQLMDVLVDKSLQHAADLVKSKTKSSEEW